MTDYNEVEIAAPGSRMYQDAYNMAMRSGKAFTMIDFDDESYYGNGFQDMQSGYVAEDTPDRAIFSPEMTPEINEIGDIQAVPDIPAHANYIDEIGFEFGGSNTAQQQQQQRYAPA